MLTMKIFKNWLKTIPQPKNTLRILHCLSQAPVITTVVTIPLHDNAQGWEENEHNIILAKYKEDTHIIYTKTLLLNLKWKNTKKQ